MSIELQIAGFLALFGLIATAFIIKINKTNNKSYNKVAQSKKQRELRMEIGTLRCDLERKEMELYRQELTDNQGVCHD